MEIDLARAHPGSHSRYDKKKKILYKEFVSKGLEEFKHSTGDSKVTKRLTQQETATLSTSPLLPTVPGLERQQERGRIVGIQEPGNLSWSCSGLVLGTSS